LKKAAFLGLNLVVYDPILTHRNATMQEVSTTTVSFPSTSPQDALTEVLRNGAQRLLADAVEAEVMEWIDSHAHVTDAAGRRQVVRNGYLPKRSILTGIGPVQVEQSRVLDRRGEEGELFSSKILPPYLRKTRSLEELIPSPVPQGRQHG
jgi:hypothetical protein